MCVGARAKVLRFWSPRGSTAGSCSAGCRIWLRPQKSLAVFQAVGSQDEATTRDGSRVLVVDSDKGIKARRNIEAGTPVPCGPTGGMQVFDVASGGKELAPLPESDAVTSARDLGE